MALFQPSVSSFLCRLCMKIACFVGIMQTSCADSSN